MTIKPRTESTPGTETTKYDLDAPLTAVELLKMKARYKDNPALQRVICEAIKRRLESECIPAHK